MTLLKLTLSFFLVVLFSAIAPSQQLNRGGAMNGTIPVFPIEPGKIAIGKLAQPFTPFDKVGRKFAILGYESGTFEAWAYPLKLFRNFQFSFYLENSTRPIIAVDIVRYIDISPEATTITYVHQSFTVRATYITPVNEAGAMILLYVDSVVPLKIVCSFLPVLQPMWPAGLGGQYAYWDDDLKAYVISEASHQNYCIVGSPAANGISYTPAHMLSDYPNEFTIEIKDPPSVVKRYIPIYLAGGKGKWDFVKAVYDSLKTNPEKYYRECVGHYQDLEQNTLQIDTPVNIINMAFRWAKIAYDNLVVSNPDLGMGLVAGLGMSGISGRPGFGWFFGGDTYINSFSMNSYGAYHTVRDALAFTEKWQRGDGKMAHEISQAAGYIDWFKNYGFGYIHADTTPLYIDAIYDYYRLTDDKEFIEKSWSSIKKAYDWCLTTDVNMDGLMDNSKAGLGAVEYGSLVGIESDVYLSAIWVRATYAMAELAKAVGDKAYEEKASLNFERASKAYEEKFWNSKKGYYSFAFNAKGEQVDELSPWMAVGLSWNIGKPEHAADALRQLALPGLTTDWGVRSISNKSKYYDPLNYNYGAVWPFITGWASTAEFIHKFNLQGYGMLMASVRHTFDNEPGCVSEVFSGATNVCLSEAVSHQGFSTSGVVLPLVRGLFGLDGDAAGKMVTFAPQFPANWEKASASEYKIGNASFSFYYHRTRDRISVIVRSNNAEGYTINFMPLLGLGTNVQSVEVDGKLEHFQTKNFPQGVEPIVITKIVKPEMEFKVSFIPTVELLPPSVETRTGDEDSGLKIISMERKDRVLNVEVQGLTGKEYALEIVNPDKAERVYGGKLKGNFIEFRIPMNEKPEFVNYKLSIVTK